MTQRVTEDWCLQYLQHFYRDEKISPQPARFLGEPRGFTRLEDIARPSDRSSRVMVDVLGIVVNYAFPKPSRGSHKFSVSFFVIDPSYIHPAHSISCVYFFNDPETQYKEFKVGDVVCLKNFLFGNFNNFPQLTGQGGKCSIQIFRNLQNYQEHGLYSFYVPERFIENLTHETLLTDNDEYRADSRLSQDFPFLENQWRTFFMYANHKASINSIDVLSNFVIKALFYFGQSIFLKSTLADNSVPTAPHCNVHDIFQLRSRNIEFDQYYASIEPKSIASEKPLEFFERCDLIALVLDARPGDETNGGDLVVWDGTSNGSVLSLPADTKIPLQNAMNLSQIYNEVLNLPEIERGDPVVFHEIKLRTEAAAAVSPLEKVLGLSLLLSIENTQRNHYFARIHPGTWIRVKNLKVINDPNDHLIKASIAPDTHVTVLDNFFFDPVNIIKDYRQRLAQTIAPAPSSSHQLVAEQEDQPIVKKARKESNDDGIPFTPLAYCVSRVAPNKYACFGQVLGWFPQNPKEWVRLVNSRTRRSPPVHSFSFCINVFDGTFALPVILHAEAAETFLGVRAQEFSENEEIRNKILERLIMLKETKEFIDFYVQSYLISTESANGGRQTKKSIASQEKRFAIFDTKLLN